MPQLAPNTQFTYIEQLGDPTDVGTNYVQMVISYSASSKVIATINATNKGGQRFTGTFQVPSDITGNGYYLDIKSTVYSDAGYTVLNTNYSIVNNQFLVTTPLSSASLMGGSDGIDEATLIKILEKMLGQHIGRIKIPEYKEIDFSPLTDSNDMLLELMVESLKNHGVTHGKLDTIHAHISNSIKSIPKHEPIDTYPIIEGIQNVVDGNAKSEENILGSHKKLIEAHKKHIEEIAEKLNKRMGEIENKVKVLPESMRSEVFQIKLAPPEKTKDEEKKKEIDPRIKKLLSPYHNA